MSSLIIKDGTGTGNTARVDTENRVYVRSLNIPLQHNLSHTDEQAYQVLSNQTLSGSGTVPVLVLNNTDPARDMVVTYIRWQVIGLAGGTAIPDVATYMRLSFGRSYSSGGTALTPVNMSAGSANAAVGNFYGGNPTMTGTATEWDRWYPKASGDMHVWNKEGSLVVPAGQTLEMSLVTDHTAGTIMGRISFLMMKPHA